MDTSSELHRHQCEVRWCITQGFDWFKGYAAGVKKARGSAAAKRLWDDVKSQAAAGNTGQPGAWASAPSTQ